MSNLEITGAKIYAVFDLFGFEIVISEAVVNAWIIMAVIAVACIWLTRGLNTRNPSKKQRIAELIVKTCNNWVQDNMGERFGRTSFPAFIAAVFAMCSLCGLSSLLGVFAPNSDLSTVLGWALLVFLMITYFKLKTNGFFGYLKGFTEPIKVMTPLNIIGEFATPISMTFRQFGNAAAGSVITTLIYAALISLNQWIFHWIPGVVGELLAAIPFAAVGIPAVLSIYFDLFSSCVQAFIFSMLTMSYIASAASTD